MSSSQKRKREVAQPRKGFKINAKAAVENVAYVDSEDETSPRKSRRSIGKSPAKSTVVAKTKSKSPKVSPKATSKSTSKTKTDSHAKTVPETKPEPESEFDIALDSKSSKKEFHYPKSALIIKEDSSAYHSNAQMLHSDKLKNAVADIANQEIEALQKYFQENSTKPEILAALKAVLNETVDEVQSVVTDDVNFLPEFKDAKERKEEMNLEKMKKEYNKKLKTIEDSIKNFKQFSEDYDINIEASVPSSSGSSSNVDNQYAKRVVELESIVNQINDECDYVINSYINSTATAALTESKSAQEALYTSYQSVRKANNNNNGTTVARGSKISNKSEGMDMIDYTNLLLSQTNSKLLEATSNSNMTTPTTKAKNTKVATGKKLLRGFGKL